MEFLLQMHTSVRMSFVNCNAGQRMWKCLLTETTNKPLITIHLPDANQLLSLLLISSCWLTDHIPSRRKSGLESFFQARKLIRLLMSLLYPDLLTSTLANFQAANRTGIRITSDLFHRDTRNASDAIERSTSVILFLCNFCCYCCCCCCWIITSRDNWPAPPVQGGWKAYWLN